MKASASVPFEKHHLEFLRSPERAQAYLKVALEEYATDHNTSALLLALKDTAAAQGSLGEGEFPAEGFEHSKRSEKSLEK